MLRLRDDQAGAPSPVSPARRGELTTYVAAGPGETPGPADLRAFLLADLIGRVAARHGLRVSAWHGVQGGDGSSWGEARRALNIYPAGYSAQPPEPLDIGVGDPGPGPAARACRWWLRPGEVLAAGPALPAPVEPDGRDPLSLRLAFLAAHYREAVSIGPGDLAAADADLRRWREQVARWATSPSQPMCSRYLRQIADALDDDLDTPAALGALRALARDEQTQPGSKFETFAYLDQILGLDLARDVGR